MTKEDIAREELDAKIGEIIADYWPTEPKDAAAPIEDRIRDAVVEACKQIAYGYYKRVCEAAYAKGDSVECGATIENTSTEIALLIGTLAASNAVMPSV